MARTKNAARKKTGPSVLNSSPSPRDGTNGAGGKPPKAMPDPNAKLQNAAASSSAGAKPEDGEATSANGKDDTADGVAEEGAEGSSPAKRKREDGEGDETEVKDQPAKAKKAKKPKKGKGKPANGEGQEAKEGDDGEDEGGGDAGEVVVDVEGEHKTGEDGEAAEAKSDEATKE